MWGGSRGQNIFTDWGFTPDVNETTQPRKKKVNSSNNITINTGCTDVCSKMKQYFKYAKFLLFKMVY